MIERDTFTQEKGDVRLDAALFARYPRSTRAFCGAACEAGRVTVNGRRAHKKGLRLAAGDVVTVAQLPEHEDNRVAPDAAVPLCRVYADEALLAFDKPAGMSVQPLRREEKGTLANGVVAAYPECAAVGETLMAGALHRIDAGTSGLVLFARTAAAYAHLRAQFAAQTVEKTYLARVEGVVTEGGTLESDLIHMPGLSYCKMVDVSRARICEAERRAARPMHAVTVYRPLHVFREECDTSTLLEVTIRTGVTHQIRAQLAQAGMPIVNDRVYGGFAVENQVGHRLHALSVRCRHPLTDAPLEISASEPSWALHGRGTESNRLVLLVPRKTNRLPRPKPKPST